MKIIIIGAGISGLSSYLLLRTHLPTAAAPAKAHEIVIYESYNANPHTDGILDPVLSSANGKGPEKDITVGGGLGVMQNGQAVIRRLSPELDEAINRAGYPISSFRMSNARGWTLANFTTDAPGGDVGPGGVLIARQALWRCIRNEVLRRGGKIVQKKVVDITMDGGPAGDVKITFEDGGSDSADLLIGADGLHSICRRAIFAGTNTPESEYEAKFE
jgi:2-polyprenyl-6-methoxyphenol hydroxylase-like FAD-dependent oxidoreductase